MTCPDTLTYTSPAGPAVFCCERERGHAGIHVAPGAVSLVAWSQAVGSPA
jgi:hypothetical protein